MPSHSHNVTKQTTALARKLGYAPTWIAGQISAELVPDYRLPWARQREAWAAIRELRRPKVPADVVAVELALHGNRGFYTRLLPHAIIRFMGVDRPPVNSDEQAAAAATGLFDGIDGNRPAAGPMSQMVKRILDANSTKPPMVGPMNPAGWRAPLSPSSDRIKETVHAVTTTRVGLEDIASSFIGRVDTLGSEEALRAVGALTPDLAKEVAIAPSAEEDWRSCVAHMDRWLGGVSWAAVSVALVRNAEPDVLVGAVRMAGEYPFSSLGVRFDSQRDRIAGIAAMSTTTLFHPFMVTMLGDMESDRKVSGIPFLRALGYDRNRIDDAQPAPGPPSSLESQPEPT